MNKKLKISHVFLGALCLAMLVGCKRDLVVDSTAKLTSIPYVEEVYVDDVYAFSSPGGIYNSIPDTIALIGDSLVGFEGGFGGVTGHDFIYLLKSDITSWPDTTGAGGFGINFQKFNSSNYKVVVSTNIVIADPIAAPQMPGPTDLAGNYRRTSNGFIITIYKASDGVYVITIPGGAGVPPNPYLLYNYRSVGGTDSLAFAAQPNACGGGTKLVNAGAPPGLSIAEYDALYPPAITSLSPVTLQWRIYEFPDTDPATVHTGAALCQWGLGVRTFVKQ